MTKASQAPATGVPRLIICSFFTRFRVEKGYISSRGTLVAGPWEAYILGFTLGRGILQGFPDIYPWAIQSLPETRFEHMSE